MPGGVKAWIAAAMLLAVAGGLWWYGAARYNAGFVAAEVKQEKARRELQIRLDSAMLDLSRKATALELARQAQNELARGLEDDARKDPDGQRLGIGAGGMSRLERRWGDH